MLVVGAFRLDRTFLGDISPGFAGIVGFREGVSETQFVGKIGIPLVVMVGISSEIQYATLSLYQ